MSLQRRMQIIDGSTPDGEDSKFSETALRIAFATSDMTHVNQHFGSAKSFAIYAINPDDSKLLEASQFGHLDTAYALLNQKSNQQRSNRSPRLQPRAG